jgi:chromosome segregation ATPase
MKRKGEEFESNPCASIEIPVESSAEPMLAWEATRDAMKQLVDSYDNEETLTRRKTLIHSVESNLTNLEQSESTLESNFDSIITEIVDKINESSKSFSQEEQNLQQQQKHITDLENEVNEIRYCVDEAKEEELTLQKKILHYKEQASERVERIDEVEVQKKEEVYRLQTQISLHAHVTGIKWNYDDIDSIKGEIDIPSKQIQKKFEIEKEGRSDFDIVNQFWSMMEA